MFIGIGIGLPVGGQQGSFNPASISGLSAWFKSDAGVSTVGSAVTTWNDQSGNGNNASAIGVPNRPVLNTGGINGLPYITFDGTNSEMQTTTGASIGSPSHTIVVIGRITSVPGGTRGMATYGKGSGAGGLETSTVGQSTALPGSGWWYGGQNDNTTGEGASSTPDTSPHTFIKIFDNATTTVTGYEAASVVVARNTGVYNIQTNALAIGTYYGGFAPGRCPCDLYEIIYYNKALSIQERQQIAAYATGRYGLPAPSGFLPSDLPNLALWSRADAGVYVNAGTVSTWYDLSGNSRTWTQGVVGAQPIYTASAINGLPALTFDGARYMQAATGATYGKPVTVFLVARYTAASANQYFFDGATNNTLVMHNVSGTNEIFAGNLLPYGAQTINQWYVMGGTFNGASSIVSLNGIEVTGNAGSLSNTGFTLGAWGGIGFFLNGDIAEVVVYNAALTLAQRTQVSRYLGTKYNIAVA